MPSWNTLLIVIISVFLAALAWSLYRTLKAIYQTDSLIIEKALKQNDANLNSFSMAPNHYLKRRFSQPQSHFAESFMELSKEQPSTKVAAVSTSTLIERPKDRDDIANNRSMDFLLFATTRRACANSSKISHRIDGIDLDSSFHKIKNDLEKPSNDTFKDEINHIEKEMYRGVYSISLKICRYSMSRFDLFRSHIWSELKHYHYILALFSGNSRQKPLRHHASHNSALYLILIFVFTMASSIMGSENLTTLNLLLVGCIALVALIPLAIHCYQSTEQDTCSVEYLLAQKTPEDSLETKTMNYISQAQQQFAKNSFSIFFHILGLAAGIASFSQVQRLEVFISTKFLTSLVLIVGVDVLLIRNLVVTALTLAAPSSLKERLVKTQIRSLLQLRCFSPSTIVAENIIEASAKKIFMTEKENNKSMIDNSCEMIRPTTLVFGNNTILPSFRGNNKSIITTINDVEEIRSKRQRTMSFSEKEKYEDLLMNNPHMPHDEHIKTQMEEIPELKRGDENTLSIEDLGVAQKLSGMKQITHFPLQGIVHHPEDVSSGIDTRNQDQSHRRLRRMDWKNKFYSQNAIEIPEQSAETTPVPHPNEDRIKTPKEFTSSIRFFEELEAALNTSIERKRHEDPSPKHAELPQFSYQELHSRSQTDSQIASKTDIHNHNDSTASNILYHLKGLESAKKLDRPANSCFNGPKSSIVISGTTLASLNHDRSKHRSSIENIHGEKPSLTGTPRSFTPSIANFDHDRGSQKAFPEFGSIYSRLSAGDSQPELRNDIENLKHLPRQNENFIEGRTESDLGDFDNNGKYEYRLSGRDFRNRDVTLRPIQENGYIVRDRNKRQITENDIEESLEVTDLAYKGGKIVGDETDLKRRRVVHRVPLHVERSRYESAEKPKIRKLGQAAGYANSKSYFDNKPTSASKGYGYNFGFNASSHHDSKFKPRKCVSVDREDEEDIDQIRLPKLNKTNNQGGDRKGEKKVIQSLNKVPSFPELKGTSTMIRSQVI